MIPLQYQPLYNAATGALTFLNRQIAEMERLTHPWEAKEMAGMISGYRAVALDLKAAKDCADGVTETTNA